jgi:hypothetical protein
MSVEETYFTSRIPKLFLTNRIDATRPPGASTTIRPADFLDSSGDPTNTGGALYEDGDLSALKGVSLSGNPLELHFHPFVDGTFGAVLTDGDDFKIIEGHVCGTLWPDQPAHCGCDPSACGTCDCTCVCGAPTYWGY